MCSDSLVIQSPAKINLALAVGPSDANDSAGRHPICSWMLGVNLYDELTITALPEDRFSRYAVLWHIEAARRSDIDWSITSDLAVRAHLLLEEYTERRLPVQLKLEKRIPVGAGLGGGSSNAAAMLRGCNDLFKLGLSLEVLCDLSKQLGSDVAFFLEGMPALVRGFGERLDRLTHPERADFVLIFPEFGCNTAKVYQAFDALAREGEMTESDLMERFESGGQAITDWSERGLAGISQPMNDLMWPAFHAEPELRRLWAEIGELVEIPVHLTGSGSTLFLICDSEIHAQFTARAVNERIGGVSAIAVCVHDSIKS